MGFKADIVVWQANNCGDDTATCDGSSTYSEYARFTLHKVRNFFWLFVTLISQIDE